MKEIIFLINKCKCRYKAVSNLYYKGVYIFIRKYKFDQTCVCNYLVFRPSY